MKTPTPRELRKALRDQDFIVEQTSQGHYKVTPPEPQLPVVHMGRESGDYRAIRNTISQLKRSGFVPPWDEPTSSRGEDVEDMPESTNGLTLNYLDDLLDLYAEVKGLPADQLLFTRENRKWTLTVSHDHVVADGDHGQGGSPVEATKAVQEGLREGLRERIRKLQELEERLG